MNRFYKIFLLCIFSFPFALTASAQKTLFQDYSTLMEIPEVVAMEASPTHLYVLSEKVGLAVFRTYPDSLQWLYSSSGMQRRGNHIMADIRFAYLFGDSQRLTVLEPTSVLGVYSSTGLAVQPNASARMKNSLYLALGQKGLGKLLLTTPETVDSDPTIVAEEYINGGAVLDVRSSNISNQLFVLTDAPSLHVFAQPDTTLVHSTSIRLNRILTNIFIDGEQIWGTTANGEIFEIRSSGLGNKIGTTNEPIDQIYSWREQLFVRTESGRLWVTNNNGLLEMWKDDPKAGNFITGNDHGVWISENDNISKISFKEESASINTEANTDFRIKPISDKVLAYPGQLLLALELEGDKSLRNVEFSYRSVVDNAKIRGQGFYWKPNVNQVGNYAFTILASNAEGQTDSTRFVVEVRSFNSPPRFSPVRASSIPMNEKYQIQFNATDPENPQKSIVRYIGVDMPDGASINEGSGVFSWTPSERQVGEHTFKVIATDRMGAASSIDVTLKVLEISRDS
jgi:hypothetical protein